jgi:hypothetical protein
MTFKMDHALEQLGSAVADLATMRGLLRDRVIDVYCVHLAHLRDEEFEGDARRDFEALTKTLRKRIDHARLNMGSYPELGRSAFDVAKTQMREKTAQKIAKSIVNLYFNVNNEWGYRR